MEIDVGAYIGDLLFDHNSVNIPGLGGFVARYKPAFSDQVQGELHPPAKGLNFNGNLVVDDGLLAEYIRDKHQLSLGEARQAVDDYVQKVREAIARREIVVFPKVGRLYKDYENNLQFLADGTNFNTDSYGLPIVHFYPVSRTERPAVKPVATPKPPPRPAMKDMRTFFSRLFGNGLAVIIGLAVVVVVVAIYFLLFNRPGKDPETGTLPTSRINVSPSMEQPADTSGEDDDLLIDDSYIGEDPTTAPAEPDTEGPTAAPGQRYFIIALGAYGNEQNAEGMVKRLFEAGYEPYTEKTGNLTRVGIQKAYTSDSDLQATLEVMRKKFSKDAKVWKVKR